jgi:SNF2 family DNA or RNA helicase
MLTPQAMTEPSAVADAVVEAARGRSKPVLACWMGDASVIDGRRRLAEAGIPYVEYNGGIGKAEREEAVDSLQAGEARAFVGNGQSGGIGLTLTKAETVIYYSNDFNLETRLQSEDRAHRIGTVRNVTYIDLAAVDTIDERIALALQVKEEVASIVLGDRA